MGKIEFRVSAKAARLIGRENISDVDGAIIELIKNSYDADADCVFIKFYMPFPSVPKIIAMQNLKEFFQQDEIEEIIKFYELKNNKFYKRNDIDDDGNMKLQSFLFSKNKIIIVDNGYGMSKEIMETSWMNIGTSDKEINVYSKKGRIKTGAKGIGRFALDKLSIQTKVYTKNDNDQLISWSVDWDQFSNAKLLNQIKADLDVLSESYIEVVKKIIGDDFEKIKNHNWDSGTTIILSPTREQWSERLFNKVNTNLKSINPLGSVDKFEIFVEHEFNRKFVYHTDGLTINEPEYDYRIRASYDGDNTIKLLLKRNEVDINKKEATFEINNKNYVFSLEDFWDRDAFKKQNYYREDYEKEICTFYTVNSLLKNEDADKVSKVGAFTLDFYFLKSGNSDIPIIKPVLVSKRKKLLKNFSGIKLYRDNFKVRPYGDDGSLYDWLSLGKRAQLSPAGAAHPTGDWRTLPYQTIGSVKISRVTNPSLFDMANREGLVLNETYYIFIHIIQKILEKFEFDRQYIYREYGLWYKLKKDAISKKDVILEEIRRNREQQKEKKNIFRDTENKDSDTEEKNEQSHSNHDFAEDNEQSKNDQGYTKEDYEEVIYNMGKDEQDELKTNQILMAFSSAGVITNTFAHEISRIYTEMGSRVQHLRESIRRLMNYKEYDGDEDFNPFEMLDECESTDKLLSTWINVIMNGVKSDSFEKNEVSLNSFIEEIIAIWAPLMEKKYISFQYTSIDDSVCLKISKVDLYLVFNNFFLNSAWFLEEANSSQRIIEIEAKDMDNTVNINLKNNGPMLDQAYKNNPDEIFNAGVTSKNKNEGTGLGLWISREAVIRNSGEIHVMDTGEGFGISISLPK